MNKMKEVYSIVAYQAVVILDLFLRYFIPGLGLTLGVLAGLKWGGVIS